MAWEQRRRPKCFRAGKFSIAQCWALLISVAVVSLLVVMPRCACAERILIVRPEGGQPTLSEVFNRLRGELRMRGFETVLVSEEGPITQAELRRIAGLGQSDAAVAIEQLEGEPTCHVWFADRESARDRLMSISVPDTEEAPALLALRTVELLRSLRERAPSLPARPPTSRREQPAASRSAADAGAHSRTLLDAERYRYAFRLGGSVMWTAFRRDALLALVPSVVYGVTKRYAVGFRGSVAMSPIRVDTPQAQGEVHTDLALLELRWAAGFPNPTVRLELSGLAGLARCAAKGESRANSQLAGRTAIAWPFAIGLGGGSWVALASHWRFGVTTSVGVLVPKPVLRVERTDTTLGRPWFEMGAGLEYAIP